MRAPLDVTIVVPYHQARVDNGMLLRAVDSCGAQTMAHSLVTVQNETGEGAGPTRMRGVEYVSTPWVAFLDSDDYLDPVHIEKLYRFAQATEADYVYPWFRMEGGSDPFPMFFGKPWDNAAPHSTTITILARTDLVREVGFGYGYGEDYTFTLGCVAAGAKIMHLPERTWTWVHHGMNSSGQPGRGDA